MTKLPAALHKLRKTQFNVIFPLGSGHLISLTLNLARNYEPIMKLKKKKEKKLLKCIRTPKEIDITVRGSIYNIATTDQDSVEHLSIDRVI